MNRRERKKKQKLSNRTTKSIYMEISHIKPTLKWKYEFYNLTFPCKIIKMKIRIFFHGSNYVISKNVSISTFFTKLAISNCPSTVIRYRMFHLYSVNASMRKRDKEWLWERESESFLVFFWRCLAPLHGNILSRQCHCDVCCG